MILPSFSYKNTVSKINATSSGFCHSSPCIQYNEISRELFSSFIIFLIYVYEADITSGLTFISNNQVVGVDNAIHNSLVMSK